MATDPPSIAPLQAALAVLPVLGAAAYAILTAALGSLSPSRRVALRDSLTGPSQRALTRYVLGSSQLEARWLVLRVAGIAATSALLAAGLRSDLALPVALVVAVLAYAVPSELGRQFVRTRAETTAPLLLRLLRPGEWLAAPIADPLHWLASRIARDVRVAPPSAMLTGSEVELIVSEGEATGALDHEQSAMIRNVLDFGEVTAEEVMVPRIHVDSLDAALSWTAALREVQKTRHSRYPVYEDSVDNIVGVLHVKDLMTGLEGALPEEGRPEEGRPEEGRPEAGGPEGGGSDRAEPHPTIRELARKPVAFVAEGQLASTVLRDMRAGRHHMAVVIDEFGGFSGIVTLEDLLEEIVGDIQDEHDREDQARIELVGEGRALVDASVPVTDVNRTLGTNLPEGDYVSLGGLLLDRLGGVPATGTQHDLLGLSVVIRDADEKHVALVELTGLPRPEPPHPEPPSPEPPGSPDEPPPEDASGSGTGTTAAA